MGPKGFSGVPLSTAVSSNNGQWEVVATQQGGSTMGLRLFRNGDQVRTLTLKGLSEDKETMEQ